MATGFARISVYSCSIALVPAVGRAGSILEPAIFPTFLLRTPKFADFLRDAAYVRLSSLTQAPSCLSHIVKEPARAALPANDTEPELDRVSPFYAPCFGLWPAFFSDFYFSATRVQKIETNQRNDESFDRCRRLKDD